MDNLSNFTLYVFNATGSARSLIELILKAKNRESIAFKNHEKINSLVIYNRGTYIRGLRPIIEYLEDKYPEKQLFPNGPEIKAVTRTLLDDILTAYENSLDLSIFQSRLRSSSFVLGDFISIIDLALLPILPGTAEWEPYRKRVTTELTR